MNGDPNGCGDLNSESLKRVRAKLSCPDAYASTEYFCKSSSPRIVKPLVDRVQRKVAVSWRKAKKVWRSSLLGARLFEVWKKQLVTPAYNVIDVKFESKYTEVYVSLKGSRRYEKKKSEKRECRAFVEQKDETCVVKKVDITRCGSGEESFTEEDCFTDGCRKL